ncbi:MAG: hypothetical protein IPH00_11690 [Flavobacteriales bacterium]|nr:hypothetical protein [Flavobacteriales bacterium]
MLLKLERKELTREKALRDVIDQVFAEAPHRSVQPQVDVDPASCPVFL